MADEQNIVDDEKARAKQLQLKKLKAKKRAMERYKNSMKIDESRAEASKKRFEVKQWNAIGLWSYDMNTDICAICKENIHSPCIECTANTVSIPTIEMAERDEKIKKMCTVAFGKCKHAFHWHCIDKWLNMVCFFAKGFIYLTN